jgi:type IV pilus assembly protein PilM
MVQKAGISEKSVSISMSGPSVIVRFISLPKMDEEALKGAMKYEAGKFIPFDMKDCAIDYKTIGKDDRENKLNILLVAVKRDVLMGKIKMVEDAGLSVSLVDVDVFALANAFMKCISIPTEKTVALVNIGASFTNLSILRAQSIYFARDLAIGGKDINAAISKTLGIDEKSAEELKVAPGEKLDEVAGLTKPVLNNLLDEVKLSFSYYENQSGKNIDEVYVSGGGSGMAGLSDVFQENLGSKPSIWNPMQFIDTVTHAFDKELLEKTGSSLAITVGLALR